MVRETADVTIVGGGPAGSVLAVALARQGVRVVLYEKARHPRLKPCGEGLLPHGVAALQEIVGVPDVPRVRGLRFRAGEVSVNADFPVGYGLVVRRDKFDAPSPPSVQWFLTLSGSNSVVECQLPKLKVAGSTPVSRSI